MSFGRKVERKISATYAKIVNKGETREGADGNPVHVLGSSQAEATIALRAMLVPPAPPGAPDTDRDDVDPVEYRRTINRRKRERRARRAKA